MYCIYDSICKQQLKLKKSCTFSKVSHRQHAFHWQLTARNDTLKSGKGKQRL